MARAKRVLYEGAWYHVMNRGINRNAIFIEDAHRFHFLSVVREAYLKHEVEIHAYCLMGNHYHLLMHTPLANLSNAMRDIGARYTQYFNYRENRDGPLFRGRFHAKLIQEESYLCRVSRYIHCNPVKDGYVAKPEHYRWSSYLDYINDKDSDWLIKSTVLKYFNGDPLEYKAFVDEGVDEELRKHYEKRQPGSILGSEQFIKLHEAKPSPEPTD